MNLAIFGLPGAGKGTLAALLRAQLGLLPISTGDLLRAAGKEEGPMGDELRKLPVGSFAPDELVLRVLMERARRPDCANGMILDGFPRTLAQARALLNSDVKPDAFVFLHEQESLVIERALDRLWHPASGRVYNLKTKPPATPGRDDETGEPLERRRDDQREILERRCGDFREKTLPAALHCEEWAKQEGRLFLNAPAGASLDAIVERLAQAHAQSKAKKGAAGATGAGERLAQQRQGATGSHGEGASAQASEEVLRRARRALGR